jgi:hypothetical protein
VLNGSDDDEDDEDENGEDEEASYDVIPSHVAVLPRPDGLTISPTKNMSVLPKWVRRRV